MSITPIAATVLKYCSVPNEGEMLYTMYIYTAYVHFVF